MVWSALAFVALQQEAFNERVIELLFLSRAGKLSAKDEKSIMAEGFSGVDIYSRKLHLKADERHLKDTRDELAFETREAQSQLVEGIKTKLIKRLPNFEVVVSDGRRSNGKYTSRSIGFMRIVDGFKCSKDYLRVDIDFRDGRILNGWSSVVDDKAFRKDLRHLSDSQVQHIIEPFGFEDYKVERFWSSSNFVLSTQADEEFVDKLALMTKITYKENFRTRLLMINDLGECRPYREYEDFLWLGTSPWGQKEQDSKDMQIAFTPVPRKAPLPPF